MQAGSRSVMSAKAMDTRLRTALENWVSLMEGVKKGVFVPLGRWPGFLGQGLYGHVQLVRAEMLEDASSAYSGAAVGWEGEHKDL